MTRWRLRSASVALASLTVAAACSGGGGAGPQREEQDGNARAEALLLTTADLPAGWRGASATPDPAIEACLTGRGDTALGHAYTGRFSISGAPASVGELVSVFASTDAARAAASGAYLDAALGCIEDALRDGVDPATMVGHSALDVSAAIGAHDIEARRLSFTVSDSTVEDVTLDGYVDVVVTVEGTVRIAFVWATLYLPPDASDQAAFVEAGRVAARHEQ